MHPSKLLQLLARYGRAAAGTAWAFTGGVTQQRHRDLVRQVAMHFGHDEMPPRTLPCVSLASVTSDDTEIALPEPLGADGNVSLLELLAIARLVRERRPASVFEIGTFDGRTTLAMARNAPPDARIRTLDLPPTAPTRHELARKERRYVEKAQPGARFLRTPLASRIEQLYGDSATFDFSPFEAEFVFIDGSHAYEYVLSDSRRALELTRGRPATILWHDYSAWEGVTRALNELRANDPRFAGLRWLEGTTLALLTT